MADRSILRNRISPTKLQVLGAASAMEIAAKKILKSATLIRERMSRFDAQELQTSTGCRPGDVEESLLTIATQMEGLEHLFNQMAGEPRSCITTLDGSCISAGAEFHTCKTYGKPEGEGPE